MSAKQKLECRSERRFYGYKPTVEEAIRTKMKVPREFYIVDKDNEDEIYKYLRDAVNAYPDKDHEIVLDRAAQPLISQKLQ